VLSLADVVHLLAHELARLRRWRLPFALGPVGPFDCLPFRHGHASSAFGFGGRLNRKRQTDEARGRGMMLAGLKKVVDES
jgi:hypothetical protein